ncbi:helix-turn-helix transcriptional regulator [Chitinophaga arvensicola]|uniref:AraC-type DNA-binding protein n=1 Tax=Chitinophaga arvensicola TaxID=29529 RepID=A0A1I0RFG6_9BACT|nr:AraC family transcriptional regulator [Chitinophaga arvensicola]SEW39576.1 AraC-type DNA-binding protein [Chitinophaga arvensicola]
MVFEFIAEPSFDFLTSFGRQIGVPVHNNSLKIPASLGEGSIRRIELGDDFKGIVHRYRLHQDFVLRRKAPAVPQDLITIILNSNETPGKWMSTGQGDISFSKNNDSAVQIASTDIDTETFFPAHTDIYFMVIGVSSIVLNSLLHMDRPNALVDVIRKPLSSFLFYESMTPDMQRVFVELTGSNNRKDFLVRLYCQNKVREIIHLLFSKLVHRECAQHNKVHNTDADRILKVRAAILTDLSQPPHLENLATLVGMSETKMKGLFKQVFGDSIYNYYQAARMTEAARLLRQGGLSVSETGYQLGFSNLSHFSRLFERHHGLKPKKYTLAG